MKRKISAHAGNQTACPGRAIRNTVGLHTELASVMKSVRVGWEKLQFHMLKQQSSIECNIPSTQQLGPKHISQLPSYVKAAQDERAK